MEGSLPRAAVGTIFGAMTKRPTLADVLAQPDDLDLRMVWADALQEKGDPRGELAAIQLAAPTYASWMRERELVWEHGEEWAEPIGRYFHDHDHVFEGGVFAGGIPAYGFDVDPDDKTGTPGAAFDDPAWRGVTPRGARGAPPRARPAALAAARPSASSDRPAPGSAHPARPPRPGRRHRAAALRSPAPRSTQPAPAHRRRWSRHPNQPLCLRQAQRSEHPPQAWQSACLPQA